MRILVAAAVLAASLSGCVAPEAPDAPIEGADRAVPAAEGPRILLGVEPRERVILPGTTTLRTVLVENVGRDDVVVRLEAGPVADGWEAAFDVPEVALPRGAGRSLVFALGAPPELPAAGGSLEVEVRAAAGGAVSRVVTTTRWAPADASEPAGPVARVVIGLIDSGVNPYHVEFRDASATAHPSTFLPGYPANATALALALDLPDWKAATARDGALWNATEDGKLYFAPGTKIVGMISFGGGARYDSGGHGTGTASIAAGNTLGACPECRLVAVQGDLFRAYPWIASQPWIDVVSVSLGVLLNVYFPVSIVNATKTAHDAGKAWFTGAGNGNHVGAAGVGRSHPTPTHLSPLTGPPWVIRVGAFDGARRQSTAYTSQTVEVVTVEWKTAASFDSIAGTNPFGHTSGATPEAAGHYAAALLEVRRRLGDETGGTRDGVVARGAALGGDVADGALSLAEIRRAFYHAARPVPFSESGANVTDPVTPAPDGAEWASQGYGLVNATTVRDAVAVLVGESPRPDRASADRFHAADLALRDAFWGTHDRAGLYLDRYGVS